jgi:hypothetical protein
MALFTNAPIAIVCNSIVFFEFGVFLLKSLHSFFKSLHKSNPTLLSTGLCAVQLYHSLATQWSLLLFALLGVGTL